MLPNARHEAQRLDTTGKNTLKKKGRAHLTKLQDWFNNHFLEKHGDDDRVHDRYNMESITLTKQRRESARGALM